MPSKPLILLDKKYFYLMFTWQMFISIIRILPFIKVAFHNTINILEVLTMSNKYFVKNKQKSNKLIQNHILLCIFQNPNFFESFKE